MRKHNGSVRSARPNAEGKMPEEALIVVTGAAKGVGREVVRSLAADHGQRVLALSRDAARLRDLQDQAGPLVEILPIDLAVPAAWPVVKERVGSRRALGLVNNAGVMLKRPFG